MSAVSNSKSSSGLWTSYLEDATEWVVGTTESYTAPYWLILAFCFLIYLAFPNNVRSSSSKDVHELRGSSLVHAWYFFYRRFDFLQEKLKESGGKAFQFRVLQHRIVSFSGERARQAFFSEPTLSLSQGYRILTGGPPNLNDLDRNFVNGKDLQAEVDEIFVKRTLSLIRKDRIADTLPNLLEDCDMYMNHWGTEGALNPFKQIYELVFKMTIRMASCQELSDDKKALEDLANHYWTIERCATPISLLLPWFPSPMQKRKEKATTALYGLLLSFVKLRRNSPTPSTDPIDLLIAQGDSDENIVGTIMGMIFAGVANTGVISAWSLIYLGMNDHWKKKATEEFQSMVENNTQSTGFSSQSLHRRLAMIPLNAWEDELPSVDLIIRETLRVISCGSVIRRNVQNDVIVDGVLIKRGDFLTYQVADAHRNPTVYTDPDTFDPNRYLIGREEDKKEAFSFLAWGVGRHPCAGMRLAKLEIKLVLALFLLGYEYDLIDGSGNFPKAPPQPDKNDILQARLLGDPCYLKYRKRAV